ncbi:MAG: GH116 family glycosyl hydrolase [Gemmataceae bacterium]
MSQSDSPSDPAVNGSEGGLSRRDFLSAGAGVVALSLVDPCCSPADEKKLGTHHIPADKNLDKAWVDSLFARGAPKVYKGDELTCIGMPIGGIGAGQMYLRGDGTLAGWDIFNIEHNTGYGDKSYRPYTPESPVKQAFGIWAKTAEGKPVYRTLDKAGFPKVQFKGQYPIGIVDYVRDGKDDFPFAVTMEAFSPFIPLNGKDSAIPGIVPTFRVKNTSNQPASGGMTGLLQNAIARSQVGRIRAVGKNATLRADHLTMLALSTEEKRHDPAEKIAAPEVFADFESGTYGDWKKTGDCFGEKPATGTLPNQQPVTGFGGKYLVNTFVDGDKTTGNLTSPEFTVNRPYVQFRIGGGNFPGRTCINLKVAGKVVRTATGKNQEKLEWDFWEVTEFKGKKAVIEIVDNEIGGWGHINIDDITFADEPPKESRARSLQEQPDFGTMVLALLDDNGVALPKISGLFPDASAHEEEAQKLPALFPLGEGLGGIRTTFSLKPGEEKLIPFFLTWHFPNAEHGHVYAERFKDAVEEAKYLAINLKRLTGQTRLFHDAYYDSTLPSWLIDRLMMPVSTLATNTVQWWKGGRFWAWEGVGCCHGTCTHVWNYAQAVARLFPELERSVRTMQDLGPALDAKTGRVAFRGEGPGFDYAADGQCGTVLKSYREHLMSKDGAFLKENWPKIRKVMQYAISRDGNDDGIIEDNQHNTYDIDFVGPNTFVGALYLAALEAAARMADLQGDRDFAKKCRVIAEKGRAWSEMNLWNGEYFVQRIPDKALTKFQYGNGCLADQLFGQFWANQLDLGYVYSADKVRTALKSIYRYNWAPDVAAQNKAYPPERWFARPGEAGLFTCTWPEGGRMQEPVRYRDEIWTGIEYQVAACLLHEGLLREGLSIIRGIHDRYDGKKHNPWNEAECGDHYARAMASWGCLLALAGFVYDGPAQRLGFAPRLQPENFKAFFSTAEGWGSLGQRRREKKQTNQIEVAYGEVKLRRLFVELPPDVKASTIRLSLGDQETRTEHQQRGKRMEIDLADTITIKPDRKLEIKTTW